jgi:VWA / Hh  protein intein-like
VAQSATLTLRVPPNAARVTVLKVQHDRALKREDDSYTVHVGDFYAEESRDVLINVTLADNDTKTAEPIPHLMVSLSYTDILEKKPVEIGPLICSIARPPGLEVAQANAYVHSQWLRVLATQEMQAADEYAQQNEFALSRQCIEAVSAEIAQSPASVLCMPMVIQLQADLDSARLGLASEEEYSAGGAHFMASKSQSYKHQRCNESSSDTVSAFRVTRTMDMAKEMITVKDPPIDP